jgi:predicted ATP-dependent serine protease
VSAYDDVPFGVADPDRPEKPWTEPAAGRPPEDEEERPPFVVISRADLRNRERPPWLIEGLLQGAGVVVLAGSPGLGKSFLALDIAAHIALGRKWQGRPTRQGRVLYVAGEGIEFYDDRLSAWEEHHGKAVPDDAIEYVEEGFSLSDERAVAHMRTLVAERPYSLVVLDTLSQLSNVESENDNAQAAAVLRAATRIRQANPGATVLVIHHLTKGEGAKLRGAGALRGNADAVIIARATASGFTLTTKDEHDGKMKNAPREEIRGFHLIDSGPSAVITRVREADPDLEAIEAVLADGDAHGIREIQSMRGDMSEATSKRLRRRLTSLEDGQTVIAEGAGKGKKWRRAEDGVQ